MSVKLNTKYVTPFLKENAYADIRSEVEAAHDELHNGTGKGNDFLGWLSLPENYDKEEFLFPVDQDISLQALLSAGNAFL